MRIAGIYSISLSFVVEKNEKKSHNIWVIYGVNMCRRKQRIYKVRKVKITTNKGRGGKNEKFF